MGYRKNALCMGHETEGRQLCPDAGIFDSEGGRLKSEIFFPKGMHVFYFAASEIQCNSLRPCATAGTIAFEVCRILFLASWRLGVRP